MITYAVIKAVRCNNYINCGNPSEPGTEIWNVADINYVFRMTGRCNDNSKCGCQWKVIIKQ